jgi:hypothetical protein
MQPVSVDAGVAGGGLGLATWAGSISEALQIIILALTVVLLAYRIRNARNRVKGED